jgi:hypothetical protein
MHAESAPATCMQVQAALLIGAMVADGLPCVDTRRLLRYAAHEERCEELFSGMRALAL